VAQTADPQRLSSASGFPDAMVTFGSALASGPPWSTNLAVFAGILLSSFAIKDGVFP